MRYYELGKTGLMISRLGFGGIPIQKTDPETVKQLVQTMYQLGINYIDTARAYTVSEEYLGYALEGLREHFVLASKSLVRTAAQMREDVERSLKNLRTDYIDLYQIHNPNADELKQVIGPGGALEALQEAKAAGKIGHIGITLHSLELFEQALELTWVETVMFPYNLVETHGQELIRRCGEKKIGFIAMKPLAGGAIEDAALALRFVAADPCVSVVIPGMESQEQLRFNLEVVENPAALCPEEMERIQLIRKELGNHFCRRCNYCAPCTVGIHIPAIFITEGYLSRYAIMDWALERYRSMDKKASDCIGCGICEERCPYHLPIRQMMRDAAKAFSAACPEF